MAAGEPMLDVARGDAALSRHLRKSLAQLRDRTDNKEFKTLVDDVLAGRRSMREAAMTDTFATVVNPGVEEFARRYREMPEEEKQQLVEQGRAELQARPTPPPDDDDDFGDRSLLV